MPHLPHLQHHEIAAAVVVAMVVVDWFVVVPPAWLLDPSPLSGSARVSLVLLLLMARLETQTSVAMMAVVMRVLLSGVGG